MVDKNVFSSVHVAFFNMHDLGAFGEIIPFFFVFVEMVQFDC